MSDNIELGTSTNDTNVGVDGNEFTKELPYPPKNEPTKKEKLPIANMERFHLNYQSIRDIQYAIQLTCVFVFSILIAYTSNYASTLTALDSQYLLPIVGVALISDTFGASLLLGLVCTFTFAFDAIIMYIIQTAGVGYQDYTSSTILFFLVTFIIGFCIPNIAIRRVTVVLPAVIFTTLVTTETQYLTNNFIWVIYGAVLIAICVVIAVSLLIFPRFACLEAQDRLAYSLSLAGEVFRLIDLAVLSTSSAVASDYICEAEFLLENMRNNQLMLNTRVGQSILEPKGLLRKLFRTHQSIFNQFAVAEMKDISSSILWHLQSALHAVKNISFNENHAISVEECREIFSSTHMKLLEVMELLASSSSKKPHDVAAVNAALGDLTHLCERMGIVLVSANLKYISNAKSYAKCDSELSSSTVLDFDPIASNSNMSMAASFYLLHMSELIRLINNKFGASGVEAKKTVPAKALKKHVALGTKIKILLKRHGWEYFYNGIRTSFILGVALIFVEVPFLEKKFEHGVWILLAAVNAQNDNNGSTLQHMRSRLLGTIFGAVYSYFTYLAVGNTIWINLDGINLFPTTSPSLTHVPTSAPGGLPQSNMPTSSPVLPTFSFSVPQIYRQIGMFIPLLFFGAIIRQNKTWTYFGFVAIMTATVVSFGRVSGFNYPYQGNEALADYVLLLRIQENVIGVLIVLVVSCFCFPILATDLLKMNVMDTLVKFTIAVTKSWTVYDRSITGANDASAAPLVEDIESPQQGTDITDKSTTLKPADLVQVINQLRVQSASERSLRVECEDIHKNLLEQDTLIGNSVMETLFWCKPFFASASQRLIRVENSLLTLLFSFDRISNIISKLVHLKEASQMVEIASSLHGDFTQLTREVYYILEESHQLTEKTIFFVPIKFHLPFPLPSHGTVAHPSPEVQEIDHVSIYTENETCDTTELSRLLSDSDSESKERLYDDYDNSLSQLDPTKLKARQVHINHRARLRQLDRTIANITVKIAKINDEMLVPWSADILAKVSAVEGKPNSDTTALPTDAEKGAAAGYLMSVRTCFNAYFYASANFALSLEEMSNIVFTSAELNNIHQPF